MVLKKSGMMFVLSSPSGVGKTTLTKKLSENNLEFVISISHTTRKPRSNEINGEDYHFVSEEKFKNLVKEKNFFEYANIFGNHYGTLKNPVIEFLSQGKDVLFDIDWQGTQQLKKIKNLPLLTFFIIPPNIQSVGIAADDDEMEYFTTLLGSCGVHRITALGSMTHFELPWDGIFIPQHLVRWTSRPNRGFVLQE